MKTQHFEEYVSKAYENGEFDLPKVEIPELLRDPDDLEYGDGLTYVHRQLGDAAVVEAFGKPTKLTHVKSEQDGSVGLVEHPEMGSVISGENDDDGVWMKMRDVNGIIHTPEKDAQITLDFDSDDDKK